MKVLLVLPAAVAVLTLALLSAPWFLWGLGVLVLSGDEAADRVLAAAPLSRLFDYVESRHDPAL